MCPLNDNSYLRQERMNNGKKGNSQCEDLSNIAEIIRRQLKRVERDCAASQKVFPNSKRRCIKEIIKEHSDCSAIMTNTRIIKSALGNSSAFSMSTLAGLLRYVQGMLSSSYIESQEVAVKFIKIINDLYWDQIVKISKEQINDFMDEKEKVRITGAQKAKDHLANIAMNYSTGLKLHSSNSSSILKSCVEKFLSF